MAEKKMMKKRLRLSRVTDVTARARVRARADYMKHCTTVLYFNFYQSNFSTPREMPKLEEILES